VKYGDYIARFSEYLSILSLAFTVVLSLISVFKKKIPLQNSLL
jgi:hypothetical protein